MSHFLGEMGPFTPGTLQSEDQPHHNPSDMDTPLFDWKNCQHLTNFSPPMPSEYVIRSGSPGISRLSTPGNNLYPRVRDNKHVPGFEPYQYESKECASLSLDHYGGGYSTYRRDAPVVSCGTPTQSTFSFTQNQSFAQSSSPRKRSRPIVLHGSIQTIPESLNPLREPNNQPDFDGSSLFSINAPFELAINSIPHTIYEDNNDSVTVTSEDRSSDDKPCDISYAKLIYRALMQAPNHRMVLRDIYQWIERNTDKANDPDSKGWQNSVRHNLSMNKAFTKVPYPASRENPKKGYIWVLDEKQIGHGILPTTRYRQKDDSKKSSKIDKAGSRQRSGRKGGRATKRYIDKAEIQNSYHEPWPRGHQDHNHISNLPSIGMDHLASMPEQHDLCNIPYCQMAPSLLSQLPFTDGGFGILEAAGPGANDEAISSNSFESREDSIELGNGSELSIHRSSGGQDCHF